MRFRSSLIAVCICLCCSFAGNGEGTILRVGHWVKLKGEASVEHGWTVSSAEIKKPERFEVLIGTVAPEEDSWESFELLGIPVSTSPRIIEKGLPGPTPGGMRIKVEGYYRGKQKFSARKIKGRKAGRESIEGRVDRIQRVAGGYLIQVMNLQAFLPDSVAIERPADLSTLSLIALRGNLSKVITTRANAINEDDEIPETFKLGNNLYLGGQFQWRSREEDEFDLNKKIARDRLDHSFSARARLRWSPDDDFQAIATVRFSKRWRHDDKNGYSQLSSSRLSETNLWWKNIYGADLDVIVGRQDLDDSREWLYDQDLDGVRLIWSKPSLRAELSVTTTLSNGSPRDEDSTNLMAYFSNNDLQRHLAAWVIDRRDQIAGDNQPIHFGLRAIGDWIPENQSWAEFSIVKGFRDQVDYDGVGWDLGSTWTPSNLPSLYFTAGWAFGQGDNPTSTSKNEAFLQSGFQDNNGRFGGVTSFRYYGELLDPELSNLSVYTLGVGSLLADKTSLDLVWHSFRQDVAAPSLRNTDLRRKPNGINRSLGTEIDLILGHRYLSSWDLEIVAAWFNPSSAFSGADDAFLAKIQLRYKF